MDGIINYLNQIDTNIFLYFNGLHNHYWDYFMTMYSDRFVWIPFYASFLYVMLRNSISRKPSLVCWSLSPLYSSATRQPLPSSNRW